MMTTPQFADPVGEHEAEGASNSYLMSLVALIVGLPLPFINLLAIIIFYIGNRKGSYFVRWHCTQALLSQVALFFINSFGFWWTVSIIFTSEDITMNYVYYLVFVLFFNIIEFFTTIHAAIETRKGIHVRWWVFSTLTDMVCEK